MKEKGRCLRQVIALLLVLCMAAMYPATALAAETAPADKAAPSLTAGEEVTSGETTAAIEETTATTTPTEETAPAEITVIASGEGDTYAWTLTSDGKLTISGTRMPDWSYSTQPWSAYSNEITAAVIEPGVENIGDCAFSECTELAAVTIPAGVTTIGAFAFSGCISLTVISIPASVTSIGYDAFLSCEGLTEITIPTSVTTIGDSAFWGCTSLTSVTIPTSVTTIGNGAFRECTGLTEITIPGGVKTIGKSTFDSCSGLTSVVISEGVTTIGYEAFYGCTSLTEITIPTSVATIGGYAFNCCTSLTQITIPTSVANIDIGAFRGCTSLTGITIPASVATIGDGAFSGCTSLTAITIPAGVTTIGYDAFGDCTSLRTITVAAENENYCSIDGILYDKPVTRIVQVPQGITGSVTIPEGVTTIDAFNGCTSLTAITIPISVTTIGVGAFRDCTSLIEITLPEGVTTIESSAFSGCSGLATVVIPAGVTTIGDSAFSSCSSLTEITIPAGVTTIGNSAFSGCSGLTETVIPAGVTTIGKSVFHGCSGLTAVTIPAGVTTIDESAFEDCTSLSEIAIPTSVTTIGADAFYGCTSLTEITIPASVTSIGKCAFWECTSLRLITVADGNENYCSIDGIMYDKPITRIVQVPQKISGSVTIPEGVTRISNGYYAFWNCTGVTEITIPVSVTTIGMNAFRDCTSLTQITIPEGVTTIGADAFLGCTSLKLITVAEGNENYCSIDGILYDKPVTRIVQVPPKISGSVTIPEGVTAIGDYDAFYYCDGLTTITIPTSVTTIDDYAFEGCSSLKMITIADGNENYCSVDGILYDKPITRIIQVPQKISGSVTIPEGVTTIGRKAFYGCSSLTEITIPTSVTTIGNHAFYDCSSLTRITIPASMTSIGSVAFYGCSSLTEIAIPVGLISIGYATFANCTSLTSVVFLGDAPALGDYLFEGVTANAYYPAGNATWTEAVLTADYTGGNGTITWIPWYPVISGDGSTVSEGDGQSLSFGMEAPFDQFQKVEIDGALLDPANYDVRSGEGTLSTRAAESTIVLHSDYLATLTPGEHTLMAHFTTGVSFAQFTVEGDKMTAGSLTLEGDIGVNFYMRLTEKTLADTGAKLVFTVNGKTMEVPVSQGVNAANGYRFTCKVAAKQMNDTITAQIVRSDGTVSKTYSYSVRTYFENRLKAANVTPEMKALAAAMLNYGAAAQVYFGYDTAHLANRDLNIAAVTMLDAAMLESYKGTVTYTDKNTAGITARYGTLALESTTIVRAYFQLKEGEEIASYRFTVNGKEVTPTKSGEQYVVDSEGIVAKRLNENCTIVAEKDGAVVLTMNYGAWSYAYSKLSSASTSETLKLLVSALYAYHQAASAYFAQ